MSNIVWLRHELRIDDNPALAAASKDNTPIVPVYVHDVTNTIESKGAASKWWLHHSLKSLSDDFNKHDIQLVIRKGNPATILPHLAQQVEAEAVFWSRAYSPGEQHRDDDLERKLKAQGTPCRTFAAATHLITPHDLLKADGLPYRVFTPFWKSASATRAFGPLAAPEHLSAHPHTLESDTITALGLMPTTDWAAGLRATWTPGEAGAKARLQTLIESALKDYGDARNLPAVEGTSKLSPHLHFGEISPRYIVRQIEEACRGRRGHQLEHGADAYIRQLYWREFAVYLLVHFPNLIDTPMRAKFQQFPWRTDDEQLRLWQCGKTGYPIVDAGMRELWTTGWMHNRVRMIVASFLTKHLLLPWQDGAAWFQNTLVDADTANNILGWQWVSGCGPDAAPYFRIFNPIIQGKRFDPEGDYVRRWIPELRDLDTHYLHSPWEASASDLSSAGLVLGDTYPMPLVEHRAARERALDAFASIQ